MAHETEEWIALKTAEAAFEAEGAIENLAALEAAETVYFALLDAARARFEAIAVSEIERMSAEQNADETEGTAADRLRWFQVAFYTAQEIIDFRPALAA